MVARLVRWMLLAAVAALVLLVTRSASAATLAPQCDDRGAVTFAPAPTLDPPSASIDIDRDSDCVMGWHDGAAVHDAHPQVPAAAPGDVCTLPGAVRVHAAAGATSGAPHAAPRAGPPGIHLRLERPPRT